MQTALVERIRDGGLRWPTRSPSRGWACSAGCAGCGGSSPACAPRCSCCCCWRSARCPGRSGRSAASTPPGRREYIAQHPDVRARGSTGSASSRSTPPRGSPRSTCCCSSRSSAASCRAARCTGRPCARRPPKAPARPARLPASGTLEVTARARRGRRRGREALRRQAIPVTVTHDETSVSAEKGYLKETGNLVFHLALIFVIIGVAIGHLFGWKGDVIVPVGKTFANTLANYDTFSPGPLGRPSTACRRSQLTVDQLDATFEENVTGRGQFGSPRDFTAHVTTKATPGAPAEKSTVKVNHPLEMDGAGVFLLGNGYAPVITVRDAKGDKVYSGRDAVPRRRTTTTRPSAPSRSPVRSPSSWASRGCSCRPPSIDKDRGPISVFPDAQEARSRPDRLRGRPLPRRAPAVGLPLDTAEMTQLLSDKGRPAAHLAGARSDLPAARRAGERSASTGSSGSPVCRSGTTRASSSPSPRRCSRSPA